jgi:hypothetical protein
MPEDVAFNLTPPLIVASGAVCHGFISPVSNTLISFARHVLNNQTVNFFLMFGNGLLNNTVLQAMSASFLK